MKTRVLFVADVHVGNHGRMARPPEADAPGINSRCAEVLRVLLGAARHAAGHAAPLVVLGDLLDRARTDPRVLRACAEALRPAAEAGGVFVLKGNHESLSRAEGDHGLGPLALLPGLRVIDRPEVVRLRKGLPKPDVELWMVPFDPRPAPEVLRAALPALRAQAEAGREYPAVDALLCIHAGVIADTTPPFLRDAHDAVSVEVLADLAVEYDLRAVFAGNWHDRGRWAVSPTATVLQVGALAPTGFSNPGLAGYGCIAGWPGEGGAEPSEVFLPGPRFVEVRTQAELDRALREGECSSHRIYLRWHVAAEDFGAAREVLAEAVADGVLAGAEAVVDPTEAVVAARTAAQAARAAPSVDAALVRYLDAAPPPEGVSPAAVLARVRGYLASEGGVES